MQGGFAHIHALLQAVVAGLADRGGLGAGRVVLSQTANNRSTGDFGMRRKKLRLELLQKSLSLLLDNG